MDRIIVPTGYMLSGSSAVTDLVAEFKDCENSFKTYEYILLHCPNGVFDLEDKLLLGNNAIRSDEAIRTFEQEMQNLYSKKFWWVGNYRKVLGSKFLTITKEYIDSLTDFNYPGYWYTHEEINSKMFIKLCFRKPLKTLFKNKISFKPVLKYNDGMRICLPTSTEFYSKSQKYIYEIIRLASKESKNVILDQLLLPFNLYRIDNYFDETLKVIVVERDPRDIFIQNKYYWAKKNLPVPIPQDAKEFCQYYKRMRESEIKTLSKKVLRIKFEDLIYNYELELKKIKKFLNFSDNDHIKRKEKFNPDISIKNTYLFKNKEYDNEVKIIERELKKYLYDFDKYK